MDPALGKHTGELEEQVLGHLLLPCFMAPHPGQTQGILILSWKNESWVCPLDIERGKEKQGRGADGGETLSCYEEKPSEL